MKCQKREKMCYCPFTKEETKAWESALGYPESTLKRTSIYFTTTLF